MSSEVNVSGFTPSLPIQIREPGVYEITRFEKILSGFVPKTLGLIDADECALKHCFSFSSYAGLMDLQWRNDFGNMCRQLDAECFLISWKLDNRNVVNAIVDYITIKAGLKSGEKTTAAVINYLQDNDHSVFAFTARGATERVREITRKQFESIGVDFSKSKALESLKKIKVTVNLQVGKREFPIADGLMCTHGTSKAHFIFDLLLKLRNKPDRIVYVDNMFCDVKLVGEVVARYGIPYVGFYYSRLEKKLLKHDKMVTNVQLEKILFEGVIVRGQEALDLAEKKRIEFKEKKVPEEEMEIEYLREILEKLSNNAALLRSIWDTSSD